MGKRYVILLVLLTALICLCNLSVSAEENTITRYCEYCDLTETWYPLTNATVWESKHYYLAGDVTFGEKVVTDGMTVCLELDGNTYLGNRRIILEKGATFNVQGKDGRLECRGDDLNTSTNTFDPGGCVWIKAGAEMNLYSGTLAFKENNSGRGANRGGVLGVYGTFNMYGGTIRDGVATEMGGNLFIDAAATVNLYGGQILGGTAPNHYCVYNRGKVLVVNDATVEHMQITPKTSTGLLISDQLTVRGNYTGSLCLAVYKLTEPGTDMGNSDNADLSGANIYFTGNDMKVKVSGTDLVTYLPEPAKVISGTTETAYSTLTEALENLQDGDILTLQQGVDGDLTIDKNITLELNGRKITGTLTAAAEKTVYVKDSFTADYSIADGIYGKVTAVEGDIQAAPATETSDPYLMITESKGVSFHAVGLNISGMTLKPGDAALYFNNTFAGDEKVTALVETFGVAMSVNGAPTLATMNNSKHYTQLDKSLFGTEEGNNGSLLYGIMKAENGVTANNENAATAVFGRAYVKLADGSYLFGATRSRSLKDQVQLTAEQVSQLDDTQRGGLARFTDIFKTELKTWGMDSLLEFIANYEANTLKIIILGNSRSVDSFWLLQEALKDQFPDKDFVLGIMYYSGCSFEMHMNFAKNNSPVYVYYRNSNGTWDTFSEKTLQYALQDQMWDIVVVHGGYSELENNMNLPARDYLTDYVNEYVTHPHEFWWYSTWGNPNDESLFADTHDPKPPVGYKDKLVENYGFDPVNQLIRMNAAAVRYVVDDPRYAGHINTGGPLMYANKLLGYAQTELNRDYTHLTDFGRLMVSYTWIAQMFGEPIEQINLDVIDRSLRHRRAQALGDMQVTEKMKEDIITAVNSTMDNKWDVPRVNTEPEKDDEFNVFFVSNSTCYYFTDELYAMLEEAGYENINLVLAYKSGCSLQQHWEGMENNTTQYQLRVLNKDGLRTYEEYTLEDALKLRNWDVISFDNNARSFASGEVEASLANAEPYFGKLLEAIKEQYPDARYLWHEVWANEIGYNLAFEMTTVEQRTKVFQAKKGVAQHMQQTYGVGVVPTGDAWEPVRDLALFTTPVEGLNVEKFTLCSRNSYGNFKDDFSHDGDIGGGQYLNACVWFEVLTGESCIGNTFRPEYELSGIDCSLSEEKITLLQNAAHKAVADWYA